MENRNQQDRCNNSLEDGKYVQKLQMFISTIKELNPTGKSLIVASTLATVYNEGNGSVLAKGHGGYISTMITLLHRTDGNRNNI